MASASVGGADRAVFHLTSDRLDAVLIGADDAVRAPRSSRRGSAVRLDALRLGASSMAGADYPVFPPPAKRRHDQPPGIKRIAAFAIRRFAKLYFRPAAGGGGEGLFASGYLRRKPPSRITALPPILPLGELAVTSG